MKHQGQDFLFLPHYLNRSLMDLLIGSPILIRFTKNHKQIFNQNKTLQVIFLNPFSSIDRDRWYRLMVLRLVSRSQFSDFHHLFREQSSCLQYYHLLYFFKFLHDDLEITQIYPNISKVHFVIGYTNYKKYDSNKNTQFNQQFLTFLCSITIQSNKNE